MAAIAGVCIEASASLSAGVVSIATVPANDVGRSPGSQMSAGASRNRVNEWDQPVALVTVARQIALPSAVGCNMPWSWRALHTAVLFAGMQSSPWDSRCGSEECRVGKGVSVSVDLGGHGGIQKKKI